MNFKSRAVSLLVAVAATAAPVLAHQTFPTQPPKNLNTSSHNFFPAYAVACDTAEDFFDDGGFSKFVSIHGHVVYEGSLNSDNGDGFGIRTDAYKAPASSFLMNVTENSTYSDPYISFFYQTQFGFNSDFFYLNDGVPDYVSTVNNSDGSTTYIIDAATYGLVSGNTWASVYMMDYGSDDGSPEVFSDSVYNVRVNGFIASPQIHKGQGNPQSDCNG